MEELQGGNKLNEQSLLVLYHANLNHISYFNQIQSDCLFSFLFVSIYLMTKKNSIHLRGGINFFPLLDGGGMTAKV